MENMENMENIENKENKENTLLLEKDNSSNKIDTAKNYIFLILGAIIIYSSIRINSSLIFLLFGLYYLYKKSKSSLETVKEDDGINLIEG